MAWPGPRQIYPLPTPATCFLNVFTLGSFSPVSFARAKFLVPHFGGLPHEGPQCNYHHIYKRHTTDFLVHPAFCSLMVCAFLTPPMAGSPSKSNSACQKLSSFLFLNTSLYFFLLSYQELVVTLPAAEAHNFVFFSFSLSFHRCSTNKTCQFHLHNVMKNLAVSFHPCC